VSGGCKCHPISVKRNLKFEANVIVSECTVLTYSRLNTRLHYFFTLFRQGGVNTQSTSLVTAFTVTKYLVVTWLDASRMGRMNIDTIRPQCGPTQSFEKATNFPLCLLTLSYVLPQVMTRE